MIKLKDILTEQEEITFDSNTIKKYIKRLEKKEKYQKTAGHLPVDLWLAHTPANATIYMAEVVANTEGAGMMHINQKIKHDGGNLLKHTFTLTKEMKLDNGSTGVKIVKFYIK